MPKLGLRRDQLESISSDPDTIRQFEKLFKTVDDLIKFSKITFRLVADQSPGVQDPLGSGGSAWEISNEVKNESYVGDIDSISENNGIFSFKYTGYWQVTVFGTAENAVQSDTNVRLYLYSTIDNLNYSPISRTHGNLYFSGSTSDCSVCLGAIIKVNNVRNDKVKIVSGPDSINTYFRGHSSQNLTSVRFNRLTYLD